MSKMKFKVGDEVVANTSASFGYGDWTSGLKGTVIADPCGHEDRILVKFENGRTWYFYPGNAEGDGQDHLKRVSKKKPATESAPQTYRGNGKHEWETVVGLTIRLRVPGGWLYATRSTYDDRTVLYPTFVPMPEVVKHAI